MAGTIHLGGLGSGLDTEGIITGLVQANSTALVSSQRRSTQLRSAVSTLSDIGRNLSLLQNAVSAISTSDTAACLTASSNSTAVTAKAGAGALSGAFSISVLSVASEQRTYSAGFASGSAALGQQGTVSIAVGTGTAKPIQVSATDSLASIATKINGLGLRVSATVLQTGTQARLQIRGLDTGTANGLTLVESGTSLDLNGDGSTSDRGKTVAPNDAVLSIDGFNVVRSSNQISDAVQGVTLTVSAKTTDPATISVAPDISSIQSRLNAAIVSYNATIQAVHSAAGFGTIKPSNSLLAGDSALRGVADRLASAVSSASASGTFHTLSEIGISLNRDGTLQLDQAKLALALNKDAAGAASLVANRMASFKATLSALTSPTLGPLSTRQGALTDQAKRLDAWASREQDRLDRYAETLRKQFSAMDTSVGASQALIVQLTRVFG